MTWLWVGAAAAIGAPARYLVDRAVQGRRGLRLPWGTFVVNVSGSFVLGLLTARLTHHALSHAAVSHWALDVVGTGFLGGYTTFSTYTWEVVRLAEDGALGEAMLTALGGVGVGLLAAAAGLALGR